MCNDCLVVSISNNEIGLTCVAAQFRGNESSSLSRDWERHEDLSLSWPLEVDDNQSEMTQLGGPRIGAVERETPTNPASWPPALTNKYRPRAPNIP